MGLFGILFMSITPVYLSLKTLDFPCYAGLPIPNYTDYAGLPEILRSQAARTSDALDEAITMAVNLITDENALNWFNHCGFFFEPI